MREININKEDIIQTIRKVIEFNSIYDNKHMICLYAHTVYDLKKIIKIPIKWELRNLMGVVKIDNADVIIHINKKFKNKYFICVTDKTKMAM